MNLKNIWKEFPLSVLVAITTAVFLGYIYVRDGSAYVWLWAALFAALGIAALLRADIVRRRRQRLLVKLAQRLNFAQEETLNTFALPALVCDENGRILLYNEKFLAEVAGDVIVSDVKLEYFTGGRRLHELPLGTQFVAAVGDKVFDVSHNEFPYKSKRFTALYFTDHTYLHGIEAEYQASRPVVLLVDVDDINQMGLGFRDSEYAEIRNGISACVEQWTDAYPCVTRRVGDDRFVIFAQERDLQKMTQDKFSVLEAVRNYAYREKPLGITLSIGVGSGATFAECEAQAQKALEMALGRGGDQAAIKTQNSYDFFGGVTKSNEKRVQVKTRAVASSLSELIRASESVIIMGHSFSDLDAMGAAVGLLAVARSQNTPGYIAVQKEKSLAQPLLQRAVKEYGPQVLADETRTLQLLQKRAVLIIVDTHLQAFVDMPQAYQNAQQIVVIDHHRRAVEHIQNALLFHHDPNASSTCEMVAELTQYITPNLTQFEAEALLAGIMLDTKNFVLRTRVRTFNAAAYLKGKGANTVRVKRMFENSMDIIRLRNQVIAHAQTYRDCAIAVADVQTADIRIVCAQAADELLNTTGVKASFVLFNVGGTAHISARSYGEMNVQLVMERLGGGGHQTMAAAQLAETSLERAKLQLQAIINELFAESTNAK